MNISNFLRQMRAKGYLTDRQADFLGRLQEGSLYPVGRELRFFLYAGILLFIAGAGLTVKQYFAHMGDLAVVSALTLCVAGSLAYCIRKGKAFDRGEVTSPSLAFDYVLFFACAFFAMDVAYVETQFHLLGDVWKNYLLISASLFGYFAYRYDNRLVLSLALSTLAAWFGFTLSAYRLFSFDEHYRLYAIVYGLIAAGTGILSYRLAVKRHFLGIYMNFAVHFLCVALLSGIVEYRLWSLYFPALILVCVLLVYYATKVLRFLYMVYAVIYGYIGVSIVMVDLLARQTILIFAYFIITASLIIGLVFKLSRRFKEVS